MGARTALALPIIYNVDLTNGPATLTGSITTDGALGSLTAANITSWSFSGSGSPVFNISSATSGAHVDFGGPPFLSASASALSLLPLVGGGNNGNVAFFGSAGNANQEVLFASLGSGPNYVISNPNPTVGTSVNTTYLFNVSGSSSSVATAVSRVPEPATLSLMALVLAGGAFAGQRLRGRRAAT